MKTGVIGGSGLYEVDGIENLQEVTLDTPFGPPSDVFVQGEVDGVELVFLPRHARGHRLLPSELNHRANIFALKALGCEQIVSMSAVGSFREALAPGDVVLVDQFVDRTKRNLDQTFFGDGIAAHISFGHPTCPGLRAQLRDGIQALLDADNPDAVTLHDGGTYLNMEGPAFSTLAESNLYRSWGMDVIGMTNLAEAKLAREAELCYQTLAFVTDYDCWHEDHGAVSVEMIVQTLMKNADMGRRIIREVVPKVATPADCACRSALATAIITRPELVGPEQRTRLAPIIGKYLPA